MKTTKRDCTPIEYLSQECSSCISLVTLKGLHQVLQSTYLYILTVTEIQKRIFVHYHKLMRNFQNFGFSIVIMGNKYINK